MQIKFNIPEKLNGNREGYNEISNIAQQTKVIRGQNILIDFGNCTFIQGNLCAAIGFRAFKPSEVEGEKYS